MLIQKYIEMIQTILFGNKKKVKNYNVYYITFYYIIVIGFMTVFIFWVFD